MPSIPIYRTADLMPESHTLVIVAGGIAVWNGMDWLSKLDEFRPIQWPVLWWAQMPIEMNPDLLEAAIAKATGATEEGS